MRTPADAPTVEGDEPPFPRNPSARLDHDLISLQMEDHYVRVHTARGSRLVLMPLSQAVAGLQGVEGMQTHRSGWVARAAIVGVVEEGRNLRLVLTGGLTAAVSRARVASLRAAGWLQAATACTSSF
ncbi:LytTR family DNA-binding domain-containing protein [Brevundimonas sp. SORGH_AS_0993]|uniref:LytTR family DNA-binding domain-containing protein n=1 Tax=Brevundimonas sp. SORGH_AS_0993 TaxID=3041794 RepID=UPI00277D32DE|nr:LytTR family DNA-binding domain-containing protein [Brevundimonas sp. SORGH_AS_0993]MDQ1155378.1 DNA-binding LytR/AlgR family response regulator [Brevundimonas sp. SORGH_AS_0993]